MSSEHFGKWLERELEKRSWSMSELARRCDVSHPTISRVVGGVRDPSPDLCRAIAEAFDMPEERVFRIAGLLSELPAPEDDFPFGQIYDLMKRLPSDERLEILEYIRWRYERVVNQERER